MNQPAGRPILSARDLTVALPADDGSLRAVLDGVSVEVQPGDVIDIVGPSGSGKTTFVRALARLLPRQEGELALRGTPATQLTPTQWRARVALLPQKPALIAGTVRDNLLLPWSLKVRDAAAQPADERLREVLDALGLDGIALERAATRLSVGQEARLAFARLWLTGPDVLLLDEADAALDPDSALSMSNAVQRLVSGSGAPGQEAVAVIRVRHRESDGVATRRMRLAEGALVEATS